jgi:long-chain acyl-CoA synthetase
MSVYAEKPWLRHYPPGDDADLTPEFDDALSMFRATVARMGDRDAIRYFDGRIGFAELDRLSDAFACALADGGVAPGDRVALYLQNVPQFVLGAIGAWKVGAVPVSINPMNREREVRLLLDDSGAVAMLCLETLYRDVAAKVVPDTAVATVFSTSELEFQSRDDARLLAGISTATPAGTMSLGAALTEFAGQVPARHRLGPDDPAFLTYTSGTTGPPKAAINTHGNVAFASQVYRTWGRLDADDVILGIAPLFHVTGLIAALGTSLLTGAPLVLTYRFDPDVVLEAAHETGATFTVAAITAFIALMNAPRARREQLATLDKAWSGGAPIPARVIADFAERFGKRIHNVYGMTETTSPATAVPLGVEAPFDPTSGASSIGLPVYSTLARILDEEGSEVPPGELGELTILGPQVVPGYWRKPEETAAAISDDASMRTGDIAYMDAEGWFYVVDRKKDMINAGGYKIWPREVEDVLFEHPAVREAAVVGIADDYRGETVKAVVSLRDGAGADEAALIAFCRERLASYKYPRSVEFRDELPKNAAGKVLRRGLRD